MVFESSSLRSPLALFYTFLSSRFSIHILLIVNGASVKRLWVLIFYNLVFLLFSEWILDSQKREKDIPTSTIRLLWTSKVVGLDGMILFLRNSELNVVDECERDETRKNTQPTKLREANETKLNEWIAKIKWKLNHNKLSKPWELVFLWESFLRNMWISSLFPFVNIFSSPRFLVDYTNEQKKA